VSYCFFVFVFLIKEEREGRREEGRKERRKNLTI
jgi:hypothetical protein